MGVFLNDGQLEQGSNFDVYFNFHFQISALDNSYPMACAVNEASD